MIRIGNHTDLTCSNSLDFSNKPVPNLDCRFLLYILNFEAASEVVISKKMWQDRLDLAP